MAVAAPPPFPEKFQEAVAFVDTLQETRLSEESKLLLYALHEQATKGPCTEPKPWGWSVVNNAKWQSWKQLGDMAAMEAMRLYVRTLEEELPNWWTEKTSGVQQPAAEEAGAAEAAPEGAANGEAGQNGHAEPAAAPAEPLPSTPKPASLPLPAAKPSPLAHKPSQPKGRSVAEVVVEGSWVSPYIATERKPPARYEHATALQGNQLYLIGGNLAGRYLNDTWALNLENLTWSCVAPATAAATQLPPSTPPEGQPLLPPAGLPPLAGHVAVPWSGSVLVVGGHSKAQGKAQGSELPVWVLDVKTGSWGSVATTAAEGEVMPKPRGGHSGTVIGHQLYVFGGEDVLRRPLDQLLILDLHTMEWSKPETTGKAPPPRSAHCAVAYHDRYIVLFGGGSVASCFQELYVLDTETMEWSQPETEGSAPSPRAGHAGAVLGSTCFIVGGGNNASGCADMYALDLSHLGSASPAEPLAWTLVGNTPAESAIASEGLSLQSVPMAGCMISFGGYNGKYHNTVHVYRPEGYVVVKGAALPPRPSEDGSASPAAPDASAPSVDSQAAEAAASAAAADYERKMGEAEAARRDAAAAKAAVADEVALMRRQLASAQAAQADAEKGLEDAREALEGEQARVVQLEVEVAELRQKLARMDELERELEKHRQNSAEKKGGSGIWGFISGPERSNE